MKKLTEYVDPYVGSIGHLLQPTFPVCQYPHGMSRMVPLFTRGVKDPFLAASIVGFQCGNIRIMPENDKGDYESVFDHDLEEAKISSYTVWLENSECTVSYTPSKHGGKWKCSFDHPGEHHILLGTDGKILVKGGEVRAEGTYQNAFSYGICIVESIADISFTNRNHSENELVLTTDADEIELSFSVSFIDFEHAELSYRQEMQGKSIQELTDACDKVWNDLLGIYRVEGNERQKRIFYTALYRVYSRQINISEHGEYYSGYDHQIHKDEGHEFYVDDGVWDTFRGAHPLQMLTEPKIHADILESFLRQYEQSGWLHDFPKVNGGSACMLGSHTTTLFADAMKHNYSLDMKRVWNAVKFAHFEGSLIPWHIGPETELDRCYREKGFFPALWPDEPETVEGVHGFERRQAVAVTLEQAYDDYAAAKIAEAAGDKEAAERLKKSSQNYRNVFDPEIGFMAPKDKNGEFIKPYNPKDCHAQGGRDYFAECNGWVYTMSVQHDVHGLMELLGGREAFAKQMDQMFIEGPDTDIYAWLSVFPDSTGLIGQFCMGNEPAFHIPYMYNFCGQPWKTQKIVHDICRVWFSPHPLGICGDEDGGAMSAWYVFTAMGFYPFCPGSGYYVIGSPQFDNISMKLGNGNTFTVVAEGASHGKKYIESAELNGTKLERSWFTANELLQGGILKLTMSDKPCKTWAVDDKDVPPSLY